MTLSALQNTGPGEGSVTQIAALLRTPGTAGSLTGVVERDGRLALQPVAIGRLDLAGLKALRGDLLLVEIDLTEPAELATLAEFLSDEAAPPVIVTSPAFDVQSMRALMKIGVQDILTQPISPTDLAKAIDAALSRRHRIGNDEPKKGPIVSFIKAGGGVGATSLVVQGACALGRGRGGNPPAVLDLDIQFGATATLMDSEQQTSLVDLIRDPQRLDPALLGAAMTHPHNRFDLLPALAQILPVEGLDSTAIVAAVTLASRIYSATLIDLPMLWSHWVRAVLQESDAIVLVLRLTVPSLRRARAQIDMLRSEGLEDIPLFLVANAAETGLFSSTGAFLKKAEAALGRKIDFCIPAHDAMRSAADCGQPLSAISGGRPLEAKLASMMEAVFERTDAHHQTRGIAS